MQIFVSIEVNWNVSYLANYTGTEGKLMEIQVQWNDMVTMFLVFVCLRTPLAI